VARVVSGLDALDVVERLGKIQRVFADGSRGCVWDLLRGHVRRNGEPMAKLAGEWLEPRSWIGEHVVIREPIMRAK
jgi:hypothetical protein